MSAPQLDLFGSPELRQFQAENTWLRGPLDAAKEAYHTLRDERDHWRDYYQNHLELFECQRDTQHRLEHQIASLQRTVDLLQGALAMSKLCRDLPSQETAPTPATLGSILKALLALAHPDRWSQGQPASALAHELAIAINAAREKLEGQP